MSLAHSHGGTLKRNIKIIDDFVYGVINTRKAQLAIQQESNVKEDILSRFLIESKKDKETMTDQSLRDIILNFVIADKDTSANTLSWFFYVLCKNPLVEEKIVQEVRDVTCSHESDQSIDNFVAKITDDTLDKMHALSSCSVDRNLETLPCSSYGWEGCRGS